LADLFHRSFRAGIVPDGWKLANVTPVHKKGSKANATNYRPISLLPIVSKIMEKIINNKLMRYLEGNNLLHSSQFGFRKQRSSLQSVLSISQAAEDALDAGEEYRIVSLDISSAFDKVWHAGLLSKLRSYGISGCLLNWLQNYISNRKPCVVYQGFTSPLLPINAGVPQGSVLGPSLFLLYINDLPYLLKNDSCLFADDTSVHSPVKRDRDHQLVADSINADLTTIEQWASIWQVTFNHAKTQTMTISRRRRRTKPPRLRFGDSEIDESDSIHLLGVTLNRSMDWSPHILNTARRSSQQYGALRRTAIFLPPQARHIVYKAIIRPTMEFGSPCWGNSAGNTTSLSGLDSIQRKCNLLFPDYSLDSLQHRRNVADVSVFRNILQLQNQSAPFMKLPAPIERPCNTRQSTLINERAVQIMTSRTEQHRHSFISRASRLWNTLPNSVVNNPKAVSFRTSLHKYLKRQEENSTGGAS